MKFKKATHTFLLFFCFLQISFAQLHYKFPIVNYTPRDYGKLQGVQNWALTQSREGLMYSGNSNGVIEYDGSKWKFIPAVNGKWVYSLATDSNNVMFVGSEGNFGYFEKDKLGKLSYVSLSEKFLKEEDKFFTRVWRTFAGEDRVYFQAEEAIYIYDYKTIKVVYPTTGPSFHLASFAHNTLYVRERQKGLMRCVNDKLIFIPNSQLFSEYGVFSVLPYGKSKNDLLIVTKEKGLYVYNTQTDEFKEFATKENNVWYNAGIRGGISLGQGLYAFNTELYGEIILNEKGEILHYINSAIGLQNDYVVSHVCDRSGNLWLALDKGLARVDIGSSLQVFTGIQGSIKDAAVFNGKIFLATSIGLFSKTSTDVDFINEAPGSIWQLQEHKGKLYIVSNSGIYTYENGTLKEVLKGEYRRIKFTNNGQVLVSSTKGLELLNAGFSTTYVFDGEIIGEILGIEEDPLSNEKAAIYWVSTNEAQYRITDDGSTAMKIKPFNSTYGLTNDWKFPFVFNKKLVVGNNWGLFELGSEKNDEAIFESVSFYGSETAGKSFNFLKDYPGKTIAIIDNKPHIIFKKDQKEIYRPFLPIDLGKENALYSDNNQLYICLDEGLVVYNEADKKNYDQPFETVIRKILTKKDSVLYDGAFIESNPLKNELAYNYNELTIEVTANYFNYEDKTLFRYKMEGSDTSFSAWQSERKIKFNNLHEGSYKLIIQSKNVYETVGKDVVLEFKILPPWYRTTLAYILYVLGFILFVFLAIKVASYRLKQQNKQLDELVKLRTKEVEHKNEELKEQNEQILHQKQEITDSINYAKRIQNAILPPLKDIHASWKDTFIFFQPKDIVSGDFYWYHKISDTEFLIASADCTGHGVPGGFMSMVCSDKLNEAVNHTYEPDAILKMVNRRIKQSLRQDNKEGSTKDGMEIALLKVNTETKKVKYAGANRFLWIIRKGSSVVEEIKPTKAGIGGYTEDTQDFLCHEIQFNPEDLAYMSTDGYGDQFGGPEGKKLMTKSFKHFLLTVKDKAIDSQGILASEHINNWKANYEQVDDILVIGIRF